MRCANIQGPNSQDMKWRYASSLVVDEGPTKSLLPLFPLFPLSPLLPFEADDLLVQVFEAYCAQTNNLYPGQPKFYINPRNGSSFYSLPGAFCPPSPEGEGATKAPGTFQNPAVPLFLSQKWCIASYSQPVPSCL